MQSLPPPVQIKYKNVTQLKNVKNEKCYPFSLIHRDEYTMSSYPLIFSNMKKGATQRPKCHSPFILDHEDILSHEGTNPFSKKNSAKGLNKFRGVGVQSVQTKHNCWKRAIFL